MKEYTDEELAAVLTEIGNRVPDDKESSMVHRLMFAAKDSGLNREDGSLTCAMAYGYLLGRESILREQAKAQAEAN